MGELQFLLVLIRMVCIILLLIIRMRFVCFQSIRKETIRILIFIGNTMPVLIQGNMSVEKVE